MLHTKVMTFDGLIARVAAPSFNQRSQSRDDEVAPTVVDPETVDTLDRHFEHDLERARPLSPSSWRSRAAFRKARELAASPLRSEV